MKINKILTLAAMAVTTLFATSCSDSSDNYSGPGAWDAADGFAQLYFETVSKTESIDPADPTTVTITVSRHAKHDTEYDEEGNVVSDKILTSLPALTAKTSILVNTDDVFTVGDAVFAEGEENGTINVSFPNAEVGKEYTLQITFNDPTLASMYSKDITYTYKVTRVKWNEYGTGKFTDNFWFEDSWEVKILQRDDDHSYYRIMDPFGYYASMLDGSQSEYLDIHILTKGDKIGDVTIDASGVVDWNRICTGYFHTNYSTDVWAVHPQNFTSAALNTAEVYAYNKVKEYLEDGKTPGQIQLAPYWYMFGVGGWNYTTEPTIFINFPGFVEEYTAAITDYNFTEEVFAGEFTSGKLKATESGVKLYKGVADADIEAQNVGCYKRAEAEYGIPYMIENPYGTGANLYFYVKGDEVVIPDEMMLDEEEEIALSLQPTGMDAMGDAVYAKINAGKSSFSESEIVLNITFQTEPDKEGNAIEYGTTDEILANIKWTKVGTGMYTYTAYFTDYDEETDTDNPVTDGPYDIYQRDDKPDTYKVAEWGYGGELLFTWDSNTNTCTVPISFTGYVSPNYGNMYVSDMVYLYDFFGASTTYDDYPCAYDPSTKTFTFAVAVFSQTTGYYWPGEETLEVTWNTSASRKAAKAKANTLKPTSAKPHKMTVSSKNSRFGKGKKINTKSKNFFAGSLIAK